MPKGTISKHVVSHTLSRESRVQLIKRLLGDKLEQDGAKNLEQEDATKFVELLDEVSLFPLRRSTMPDGKQLLNTGSLGEWWRSTCVRYLARVCGWHSILPNSVQISDYQRVSEYSGGSSCTVWTGTRGGQEIAVKAVKFYLSYAENKKKRLTRVSYYPVAMVCWISY